MTVSGTTVSFGYFFVAATLMMTDAFNHSDCSLEADPGMCMAYFERFYYDGREGICKQFVYGGCGGNANNFHTLTECQQQCQRSECLLPKETGLCKAYLERFYYDHEQKTCTKFIYGGCGQNGNNFETEDMCKERCQEMSNFGRSVSGVYSPNNGAGFLSLEWRIIYFLAVGTVAIFRLVGC